ncbi:MAG: hypothetical protein AB8B69_27425 [Chitinophagales bacterium]
MEEVEVQEVLKEIHQYFQEITQISGFSHEISHLAAVPTASGMALGLNHAAQCLLDYKRTVQFLQGMVTAIRDKQKEKPGETIRIFYAGCGPYAPFITMIAPLFEPTEIQFSLLEINNSSLLSAKKLISGLNLSDYLQDSYLADAVTFKVPNPDSFHILFSETLDALLYRESYVPILWNLLPQFQKNIVLIPENVCLELSTLTTITNQNEAIEEHHIGRIFDTRENLTRYFEEDKLPPHFPSQQFILKNTSHQESIILDTLVFVYKQYGLKRGESSLTLPCQMQLGEETKGKTISFTYHLKPQIELKYEIL